MKRGHKWLIGLGVVVAVLGAACAAVIAWMPSDAELAQKLQDEASARLGVPVTVGAVHWALRPFPVVVAEDLRTQQTPPIVIGRLSVYPRTDALLHRQIVIGHAEMEDAVFPRNSVRAIHPKDDAAAPASAGPSAVAGFFSLPGDDGVLLERFDFRNVTWISYSGVAVAYDGNIDFDPHWRPRLLELRRNGKPAAPFQFTATREGDADRWKLAVQVGGGTANGSAALKVAPSGAMHLSGQLQPRGIEIASTMATFNRRSPVGGRGTGETTLSADGASVGALAGSLHTHTAFSVNPATVLRFDLDKAIRTRGKEHDGETALQEFTGEMDTQNTAEGMKVAYTKLHAKAGKYTANGEAVVYRREITASGTLDLVEGAVGVPFTVSGPVAKPHVSVPPGFFAGALIGTAILPGVGTVIGARIGGVLGRLFGPRAAASAAGSKK